MLDAVPLSRPTLLSLVPRSALRPRPRPYYGDTDTASVAELAPGDADTVRRLYTFLGSVYATLGHVPDPHESRDQLRHVMTRGEYPTLLDRIRDLGVALAAATTPLHLRKVYHDVRGGSLPGLLMHLDLVGDDEATDHDIERIFLLTRDHLKIMRNALPDLDPDGYARDLSPREHGVDLLIQKWSATDYDPGAGAPVRVDIDCPYSGGVSERCMEFAALDRVLYNLINNAARFAADRRVHLAVLPLSDEPATDLRFVVSNRVTPEHAERLHREFAGRYDRLFHGGFTTGGHGVGLQICADIVTHGYHLSSPREALDAGYLGARLIGDQFVVWFHWPSRRAPRLDAAA
jgi:signal transduction histidine kinase